MRTTINVLGVNIDNVNMQEAIDITEKMIKNGEPQIIVTPNSEIVVQAREDRHLNEILEEASMSLPDGIGLVWASRLKGRPLKERLPGIDFMTELLATAAQKKYRVYFLGAKPGVAVEAAEKLKEKLPALEVVGVSHGYFTPEDEKKIIEEIKGLNPDILFVGLGAGKQEKWIQKYYKELGVPVAVGVGGSFDVLAGRLSRAPLVFRKRGLEWLYRFIQEPCRAFRLFPLLRFTGLVFQECFKKELSGASLNILGTRVDRVTYQEALGCLESFIERREPNYVIAINPEKIVSVQNNSSLKDIVNKAGLCIADGTGILLAARLLGDRLPERVTGIDLMFSAVEMASQKGYSLFLLGAEPGVAEKVADTWQKHYPSLNICGTHHGYFSEEEEADVIHKIREASPDMLFVALGSPKQEIWINKYINEMEVPVCLGVGGSFDVITGKVRRAPEWMRRLGLEWNYRLFKEPKRIRRMMSLPKFVFMILAYKARNIFKTIH